LDGNSEGTFTMSGKKRLWWSMVFGVVLTSLLVAPVQVSSQEMKVGIVDLLRALRESEAGKVASDSLEESGRDFQTELQSQGLSVAEQEEALRQQAAEFQQKRLLFSEDVQREREEELLRQQREVQRLKEDTVRLQRDAEADFRLQENRLRDQILQEIMDVILAIGEQEKFTVIIERSQVLFFDGEQLDLTDQVIQEYDKTKR
jgi:Skp family chaperone for outer membrane proteins